MQTRRRCFVRRIRCLTGRGQTQSRKRPARRNRKPRFPHSQRDHSGPRKEAAAPPAPTTGTSGEEESLEPQIRRGEDIHGQETGGALQLGGDRDVSSPRCGMCFDGDATESGTRVCSEGAVGLHTIGRRHHQFPRAKQELDVMGTARHEAGFMLKNSLPNWSHGNGNSWERAAG